MINTKYCNYCDDEFEAENGNSGYCSDECRTKARKFRQDERYHGIRSLLPVLHGNHALLESLFLSKGNKIYTGRELELEGLDFSLFRKLYPDPDNQQIVHLDFGTYFLETRDNFQTFKINKHETKTSRAR